MLMRMSSERFTTEAALFWGGLSVDLQKRILKSALCAKCNTYVEIVNYYGSVKDGDLCLDGDCVVCGHASARVMEAAQAKPKNN